jgi:hypothetical protein
MDQQQWNYQQGSYDAYGQPQGQQASQQAYGTQQQVVGCDRLKFFGTFPANHTANQLLEEFDLTFFSLSISIFADFGCRWVSCTSQAQAAQYGYSTNAQQQVTAPLLAQGR